MRNRAVNALSENRDSGSPLDRGSRAEQQPSSRLVWLFVGFALPLAAVAIRVAQLQIWLVDDYVSAFATTTESVESIPSIDGAIHGSDGRTLVEDVERYHVGVHYRWIEDPPNERWLRQQALSRLTRLQRRDRALIEQEKRRLILQRDQMWRRLSELARVSPAQIASRRAAIQERVQRVSRLVTEGRVDQRDTPTMAPKVPDDALPPLQRIWNSLTAALTTPPRRAEPDPILVREELDYHSIVDDVPLEVRAEIEAHRRWFPGARVTSSSRRVYHDSGFAPHVIGTRVPVSDEELAERAMTTGGDDPLDYRPGDRIGRTGVEAAYDSHLKGLRGLRKLVRNRHGEIVRDEVIRNPRTGGDLELTLNTAVQQKMERLLDGLLAIKASPGPQKQPDLAPTGGCVVALDVQTGAVIVAASGPRFDLGSSAVPTRADWQRIIDDPGHPLFHRATQMALPPGSVFKALSAIAILESHRVDPDARFDCRGYLDRPDRLRCLIYTQQGTGHGPVDLAQAISRSCNVYFFRAAGVIGPEPILEWARRFGIGRTTGIDLPFEKSGQLPGADADLLADTGLSPKNRAPRVDVASLAIGQSTLTVTPLQVARMMAAIANGGSLITPFVARKAGPHLAEDDANALSPRRQSISGLSEGTLSRIRAALERTVSDPGGTGYKTVRSNSVTIAGKTGTAELGQGKPDHAWFAGYAPADNPRIAFAVVLEHAGSGSQAAGPVARQLVEALQAEDVFGKHEIRMTNEARSSKHE